MKTNIIDTRKQINYLKILRSFITRTTREITLLHALMDLLPGMVDGARKISQSGSLLFCIRALARSRRLPALPMLEATASRDKYIDVVTSIVHGGRCDRCQNGQASAANIVI